MTKHAITRALERYGMNLTFNDLDAALLALPADGLIQAKFDDGSIVWLTRIAGTLVRMVTDSTRKSVLTFLPLSGGLSRKRYARHEPARMPKGSWRAGKRVYQK